MVVRYWDSSTNEFTTRYLTSMFLGHSTASDLLSAFTSSLCKLGLSVNKLIQISVDGPNVNLKFLSDCEKLVKGESTDTDVKEVIDIGTCSHLKKVYGSYKTAHMKSE